MGHQHRPGAKAYTPPLSGWYGVVVTEKPGAGAYDLSRT